VERLVVGLVELVITIYRGTVVRLTALGDAIVSLGRRIAHRFRRQPSTGVQVFLYILIFFMFKSCSAILRLLFLKSHKCHKWGNSFVAQSENYLFFGGRSSDQ
jgi:hypothetical protein